MMPHKRYILLTSNWFIIGLTILLFNDFYLKYAAPSFLTGKLSDFAGLFIFPFFISVFIPRPKTIYLLTALFFGFWKLDFSQGIINYLSELTDLGIYRTVDPSDLFALSILPVSYKYLQTRTYKSSKNQFVLSTLISIISIFAFCATTVPEHTFNPNLKVNKAYLIPVNKETLFLQLNSVSSYSDTMSRNLKDTLFYLYFEMPDYNAEATAIAKIKSFGTNKTIIELDSITNCRITGDLSSGVKKSNIEACEKLKPEDFENIFELNYIDFLLKEKKGNHCLCFHNKEIIDKYIGRNNYR